MSKMFKIFQVLLIVVSLTTVLKASSEEARVLCNQVEESISRALPSLKLKNKMIFSKSCRFWWQSKKKENIELSVYISDTEEESKEKLIDDVNFMSEGEDFNKLESSGIWDETYFYKGSESNSSVILLRKRTTVIHILAPNSETAILLGKNLSESVFSRK